MKLSFANKRFTMSLFLRWTSLSMLSAFILVACQKNSYNNDPGIELDEINSNKATYTKLSTGSRALGDVDEYALPKEKTVRNGYLILDQSMSGVKLTSNQRFISLSFTPVDSQDENNQEFITEPFVLAVPGYSNTSVLLNTDNLLKNFSTNPPSEVSINDVVNENLMFRVHPDYDKSNKEAYKPNNLTYIQDIRSALTFQGTSFKNLTPKQVTSLLMTTAYKNGNQTFDRVFTFKPNVSKEQAKASTTYGEQNFVNFHTQRAVAKAYLTISAPNNGTEGRYNVYSNKKRVDPKDVVGFITNIKYHVSSVAASTHTAANTATGIASDRAYYNLPDNLFVSAHTSANLSADPNNTNEQKLIRPGQDADGYSMLNPQSDGRYDIYAPMEIAKYDPQMKQYDGFYFFEVINPARKGDDDQQSYENNDKRFLWKNTPHFVVFGRFVPRYFAIGGGTTKISYSVNSNYTNPKDDSDYTFFLSKKYPGLFFQTKDIIKSIFKVDDSDILEVKNGIVCYVVPIYRAVNSYDYNTFRNNIYHVDINNFLSVGDPIDPSDPNNRLPFDGDKNKVPDDNTINSIPPSLIKPSDPIGRSFDSYLSVTLEMKKWNASKQDVVIE